MNTTTSSTTLASNGPKISLGRPRLATIALDRPISNLKQAGNARKPRKMVTLSLCEVEEGNMKEENLDDTSMIKNSNFERHDDYLTPHAFMVRRRSTRKSLPKAVINNLSDINTQQLDEDTHLEVKSKGLTCMLLLTGLTITLSSFQYGWAIGVVNAPQKIVTAWYNQTYYNRHGTYLTTQKLTGYWALTVSIANLSGLFGGLSSGYLCDKLGRRKCLMVNNTLTFIAAILMLSAKPARAFELVIVARFFNGLNSGIASGAVAMYLAEISPVNLRGSMCSAHQVMLSLAVLVSQLLGLPQVLGTSSMWPVLFALSVIPAALQTFILPFLPESPRYLLIYLEKEKMAKKALIFLRQSQNVEDEIQQMKVEYQDQKRLPPVTWGDMVKKQVYRKPLIIASETYMSQQLTAISAILSYSTALFISAGVSIYLAGYVTIAMSVSYLAFCSLSLLIVEKCGRRSLYLTGLGGMWACSILVTICLGIGKTMKIAWLSYLGIVFIFGYVVFCAVGPSVIAWFIPAELFTQASRPKGASISVCFNWISSFLAVFLFPILLAALRDYVFLVFTVLLTLFWLFTYNFLPETQGRTSDELARLFMTESEINRIHKFWKNHHFHRNRTHPHHHNHHHDTKL